MEILGVLIGILSLMGTIFSIGYQFGKDTRRSDGGEIRIIRHEEDSRNDRPFPHKE